MTQLGAGGVRARAAESAKMLPAPASSPAPPLGSLCLTDFLTGRCLLPQPPFFASRRVLLANSGIRCGSRLRAP